MILQSLVAYYEALAAKGEISRPGWARVKVSWGLALRADGTLLEILPLKTQSGDGKKMLPQPMNLPIQFKRSGAKAPSYFLCDNAQYCLGIEKGQVTEKAKRCFGLFSDYHTQALSGIHDECADALSRFLLSWNPEKSLEDPVIARNIDAVTEGGNFVFLLADRKKFVHESGLIAAKWDEIQTGTTDDPVGVCMVTGERTSIARIHNSVKGIRTSSLSPNGWTLVGFDKEAFESYGKTQSFNAPVGKYAAFAYTTALNYLLNDSRHVKRFGDTTVVYWTEDADEQSREVFAAMLDGGDTITEGELDGILEALLQGEDADWNGLPVRYENRFYVLGLAPNAARLSVRFFLRDTFGNMAKNLEAHYGRLKIVSDNRSSWNRFPLWALLRETVNLKSSDKSASPQMSGDLLRAILSGGPYPATLYNQTMLRIRAEREITRGRAAIIKAYLIKNYYYQIEEALMEEEKNNAYLLGRLFAVLEEIQSAASDGKINLTIKDSYFNAACIMPMVVFPRLLLLKEHHIKVIKRKSYNYFIKLENEVVKAMNMLKMPPFPARHDMNDQGSFILGYYHQTQKRFEKKTAAAEITDEKKEDK